MTSLLIILASLLCKTIIFCLSYLHLSSIYKYYVIDIADPSSMQDMCHTNFVIDFAHCGVSVAQVEYQSTESEDLRFDFLWGLRIFSLSHACDKMKKASFFNYILCFHGSLHQ